MEDTRRSSSPDRPHPGAGSSEPASRRTVYSLSEEETIEIGRNLAQRLKGGELILLDGDLGMGKTAFTRGLATGLGVAPEDVNSPSFTLVQEYTGGRLELFHIDLYRLDDPEDFASLGLEEILASGAVVVVEWGEKLPPYHKRDAITVRFYDAGEDSRRIELLPAPTIPAVRGGDA